MIITPVGADVGVTLIFALIPILLGIATLCLSLGQEERVSVKKQVYFEVLGVVAPFMWPGLLIGPALLMIVSLIPASGRGAKS